jgi:hypothetical protein
MGGKLNAKTAIKIGYKAPDILKDITPPDAVDDPLQFQVYISITLV